MKLFELTRYLDRNTEVYITDVDNHFYKIGAWKEITKAHIPNYLIDLETGEVVTRVEEFHGAEIISFIPGNGYPMAVLEIKLNWSRPIQYPTEKDLTIMEKDYYAILDEMNGGIHW